MKRLQDVKHDWSKKELQEYKKHKQQVKKEAKKWFYRIVSKEFENGTKTICLRSSTFGYLYWNGVRTEERFDCEVMEYLAMMFELEDDYTATFHEGDWNENFAEVMITFIA